jgi:hypothetical protein
MTTVEGAWPVCTRKCGSAHPARSAAAGGSGKVVPTEVTLGMHVAKLLPDYEHLGQPATCIWPTVPLCLPEPLKLAARGARTGHAPDPSRELHTAADPVLDTAALAQAIRKQSNRYIKGRSAFSAAPATEHKGPYARRSARVLGQRPVRYGELLDESDGSPVALC